MKFDQLEKIIIGPLAIIIIGIVIYSNWGHWMARLWEVGSVLFEVALGCGLICMFIFALLYFGERKKSEKLEQDLMRLQNKLDQKEWELQNKSDKQP